VGMCSGIASRVGVTLPRITSPFAADAAACFSPRRRTAPRPAHQLLLGHPRAQPLGSPRRRLALYASWASFARGLLVYNLPTQLSIHSVTSRPTLSQWYMLTSYITKMLYPCLK